MIIDTSPYTIVQTSDGLEVRNSADEKIGMIRIDIDRWGDDPERIALHSELARLIENAPVLLSTTRRFIQNLHATMHRTSRPVPPNSLAGIISAIEGPPASE